MFKDRHDAALQLATKLEKYKGQGGVIVLGIPRGGAETAYYIASRLQATFSLIIVRKLGHPYDPEYALGAMAEDGTIFYRADPRRQVSQELRDEIEEQQQEEIERRIKMLRKGRNLPSLKGKTVIIADDGIATGATILAAIRMCKKQNAGRIVIAAPVAAKATVSDLEQEVDEVVILQQPAQLHAVSQFYEQFENLTDEEALAFVEKWESEH